MKLNVNWVITGHKALYIHKVISFAPEFIEIVVPHGNNVKKIRANHPNFDVKSQIEKYQSKFWDKKIVEDSSNYKFRVYNPERLFLEIDNFKLSGSLYKEAVQNLKKICSIGLMKRVYKELKVNRHWKPSKIALEWIAENRIPWEKYKAIDEPSDTLSRELVLYVLDNIAKQNSNYSFVIKGGYAVELLANKNRATNDIDIYMNIPSNEAYIEWRNKIKNFNSKNEFKIEVKEISDWREEKWKNEDKTERKNRFLILKITPDQRSLGSNKIILKIATNEAPEVKVDINRRFQNLNEIKVVKRNLTMLSNIFVKSVEVVAYEIIIAEKVLAILDRFYNQRYDPKYKKRESRGKDIWDIAYLISNFNSKIDEKGYYNHFWKLYKMRSYKFDILTIIDEFWNIFNTNDSINTKADSYKTWKIDLKKFEGELREKISQESLESVKNWMKKLLK